jgi:dTDP-N-acetylfucosamine:lipid II N-acetylfucosaminyltransferase
MSQYKIIHLSKDEKCINSANWQFEKVYPKNNKFVISVPSESYKLKYVTKQENVIRLVKNLKNDRILLKELENSDLVVLHGLSYFNAKIVLQSSQKVRFLWLFFGAEIYNNKYAHLKYVVGPKTLDAFPELESKMGAVKSFLSSVFKAGRYKPKDSGKTIILAAKKIENIGTTLLEDFELFKLKKYINPKAKHFYFAYYPIEFIFKDVKDLKVNDTNILLGNSASTANNHLEIFEHLRNFNFENKKIITPLSYGNKKYANKIKVIGKNVFQDSFQPLLDFMPLKEYHLLLQQCGIVIMNHYRQQAVGVIFSMIWMGAKIYLDERNTVYSYLKRLGIHVFSIEKDLSQLNKDVFTPLSSLEVVANKKILLNELGEKRLLQDLKNQLNNLLN